MIAKIEKNKIETPNRQTPIMLGDKNIESIADTQL